MMSLTKISSLSEKSSVGGTSNVSTATGAFLWENGRFYRERRRTRRPCCPRSLGQCSACATLRCSGETGSLQACGTHQVLLMCTLWTPSGRRPNWDSPPLLDDRLEDRDDVDHCLVSSLRLSRESPSFPPSASAVEAGASDPGSWSWLTEEPLVSVPPSSFWL